MSAPTPRSLGLALAALVMASGAVAAPAAKVLEVSADDGVPPDVQIVHSAGQAADAKTGDVLEESDRIRTGYRSRVKLDFQSKATVVVEELSEFKVAVFKLGKTSQVTLWLKAGELQAQVRKEAASRTEFVVKSPTATASVRGTQIQDILVTPFTGMRIRMGAEGSLLAQGLRGPDVMVNATQRGNENTENDSFVHDSQILITDTRTTVTPTGLTSQEQTAAGNQVIDSTTTVYTGSTGGNTPTQGGGTATIVIHVGGPNAATFAP